jgi:hypothetical protein
MKYGGKFHCKIISIAPVDNSKQFTNESAYFKNGLRVRRMHLLAPEHQKCECRCENHPTACFRKNFIFEDTDASYIHGNVFLGVSTIAKCSNLCSNHPQCKAWEYDSTEKCILSTDSNNVYTENTNPNIATYAGLSTQVEGGVQAECHGPDAQCQLGTYRWTDGQTDKQYCRHCPAGQWTSRNDKTSCDKVNPDGLDATPTGNDVISYNHAEFFDDGGIRNPITITNACAASRHCHAPNTVLPANLSSQDLQDLASYETP